MMTKVIWIRSKRDEMMMMPCLPVAFLFLEAVFVFSVCFSFWSLPVSSVSSFRACCIYQRLIQSSFDGEEGARETRRKEGMVKGKKKKRKCTSPSLFILSSLFSPPDQLTLI